MIEILLDATGLKKSSCPRKFWWQIVNGYRHRNEAGAKNIRMAYGSAVHKFLEMLYKKECSPKEAIIKVVEHYKPINDAIANPKEFRTTTHLVRSCKKYLDTWGNRTDDLKPLIDIEGKKAIEIKFADPVFIDTALGLTITICGTIDLIADYVGYKCLIVDHKTNSGKIEYFFEPFEFDPQMMLYSMKLKEIWLLKDYPPVMIQALNISKGTDKALLAGQFDGLEIVRGVPIQYNEKQISAFKKWLDKKIAWIVEEVKERGIEAFREPEYSECRTFGLCPFFDVCKFGEDWDIMKAKLDYDYEKIVYNPLSWRD